MDTCRLLYPADGLSTLFGVTRIWRPRRIIWTSDAFYLARPGDNKQFIDVLPLHEIEAVIVMNDATEASLKHSQFTLNSESDIFSRLKTSATDKKIESEATLPKNYNQQADEQDASIFSRNSSASSVLQIKTVVDSCTAGRTYYLSTRNDQSPEELRQLIVSGLGAAVAVARRKAIALSRFQKSQEYVQWFLGSFAFQIAMAVLIMLVIELSI